MLCFLKNNIRSNVVYYLGTAGVYYKRQMYYQLIISYPWDNAIFCSQIKVLGSLTANHYARLQPAESTHNIS